MTESHCLLSELAQNPGVGIENVTAPVYKSGCTFVAKCVVRECTVQAEQNERSRGYSTNPGLCALKESGSGE